MVQVYALKVPAVLPQETYANLLEKTSAEKRQKISRFRKQEDAYRSLLADVLTRTIIARSYGIANEEIVFLYNEYGKPYIKGRPDIHFNASHSGDWVVLATSPSRVGIDVEKISPQHLGIAKRFFSKREYEDLTLQLGEARFAYFFDLWTLKESYMKAVGKGLSIPLDSFTIRKRDEDYYYLAEVKGASKQWYFKQYPIDPAYKLSICAETHQFCRELCVMHHTVLLP